MAAGQVRVQRRAGPPRRTSISPSSSRSRLCVCPCTSGPGWVLPSPRLDHQPPVCGVNSGSPHRGKGRHAHLPHLTEFSSAGNVN